MKKKPLHLKPIMPAETIFYWYELRDSTYAIYDSDMGEPITYGSLNLVVGTLRAINQQVIEGKRNSCVLWYFKRDANNGWRKSAPPVLFNWNPSPEERRKITEKKEKNKT
jgi:hypothetical protein